MIVTRVAGKISVPYEITLLSNLDFSDALVIIISVPYEITLLSNVVPPIFIWGFISVPYEITLLSNCRYSFFDL